MTLTGKAAADFAARVDAEARKLREEQLIAAKSAAAVSGKEPFDLAKLETLCDTSSEGRLAPLAERTADFERKYYVTYPNVMTLEEFAKVVEVLNQW